MGVSVHSDPLKALTERLAGEFDSMCAETEAAVLRELPEVAERADAILRRRMIEETFRRVLALLGRQTEAAGEAATHVAFGAAAARAGVALESLTAGYRIGARVGWAHLRQAVRDLQLNTELVLFLADAHVAYVDELTANSLDGYTREAEAASGQRARERQALLDALLRGDSSQDAARHAGWPWPTQLMVAVLLTAPGRADPPRDLLLGAVDGATVAAGPGGTSGMA